MKKRISVSPISCIWFMVLLLLDTPYLLPMAFAVCLHEAGHLLCACVMRIRISRMEISMLGARMMVDGAALSYKKEFLLALGGPLAGALGFALCFPVALKYCELPFFSEGLLPFSVISLALSVFNLIPIDTLDGGRMLRCAISHIFSFEIAERVMKICTFFALVSLWSFSVYLMLRTVSGLTLFVFSAILFINHFISGNKKRD